MINYKNFSEYAGIWFSIRFWRRWWEIYLTKTECVNKKGQFLATKKFSPKCYSKCRSICLKNKSWSNRFFEWIFYFWILQNQKNSLFAFCRRCMRSFASCLWRTMCFPACLFTALCFIPLLWRILPASMTAMFTMQMTTNSIEKNLDIFILLRAETLSTKTVEMLCLTLN